jgi:hypothetical protein
LNPQAPQTTLQAESPSHPDKTGSFEMGRVELATMIVKISRIRWGYVGENQPAPAEIILHGYFLDDKAAAHANARIGPAAITWPLPPIIAVGVVSHGEIGAIIGVIGR